MATKLETFNKTQLKQNLPEIRPGDTVRVFQKIPAFAKSDLAMAGKKEKGRERAQVFEGLVIAKKHGKGISATFTVRKLAGGIGVEKIYPLHSPTIEKIEVLKRGKTRRAKLYWLRKAKGKRARLKQKEFIEVIPEEPSFAPTSAEAAVGKKTSEGKEKGGEKTEENK